MVNKQFQCMTLRNKRTRNKCLQKLNAREGAEVDLYVLHGQNLFLFGSHNKDPEG